jgi:hypothetical protein
VKTPPPESGRQVVASPPVAVSGEAEFNDTSAAGSLEPDLSGGPISKSKPDEPSAAQLGETVELEGDATAARIELLSAPMGVADPGAEIPADELELSLPQQQYGGGYDRDLAPPSRAAEDLARHRAQVEQAQRPPTQPPVSLATPPSMDFAEPKAANVSRPGGPTQAASPVVVSRPSLGDVQVAEMRKSAAAELPSTFLELLDASLSLEA